MRKSEARTTTDSLLLLDSVEVAASAILAFWVARSSTSAYRLTGRSHLLNFAVGFLCLGVAYISSLVLSILFYPVSGEVRLAHLVPAVLGYALIASSYYTKERRGSIFLMATVVTAAALALTTSVVLQLPFRAADTVTFHLLEMGLIMYTLVQITRSFSSRVAVGGFSILWGFGTLTVSQYTWVVWSFSFDPLTAQLAMALRLVGLALLVYGQEK